MMRSVRFAAFGEPAEVLSIEELPTPEPGPGQVLIRMRARPINPSDLFTIRGRYGMLPKLPTTPGFEGAGVIAALGAGVSDLEIGQQVAPLSSNGTWQEYALADAGAVLPLPSGLSDAQAAMLLVNPTTAWLLLEEVLGVQQGEWVLQNAANSAVGRFVIQLSRRSGYRTINVVRRPELRDELLALGADQVIVETEENLVERVKELTGGKGVRHAIDSVAGTSGSQLAQSLARGGTLVVFGAISGQPLTIDPGQMLFRGTHMRGWWLVDWLRTAGQIKTAQLFNTLIPLIADGTLHVPVAGEYDLADVQQAIAAAESSERNGKILLIG
jgi:NADPH:quinone reductase-like Zn-dependent oxidoreductase